MEGVGIIPSTISVVQHRISPRTIRRLRGWKLRGMIIYARYIRTRAGLRGIDHPHEDETMAFRF